jgi:glycine cleavage system H protein
MTGLRYSKEHEYIRMEGDVAVVGITDYAQSQLGDIVFIDLPPVGKKVTKGKEFAVVESVKAASDVYAPVSGEVIEVNPNLGETPALVNDDAEKSGWFAKIRVSNPDEAAALMDDVAYAEFLKTL